MLLCISIGCEILDCEKCAKHQKDLLMSYCEGRPKILICFSKAPVFPFPRLPRQGAPLTLPFGCPARLQLHFGCPARLQLHFISERNIRTVGIDYYIIRAQEERSTESIYGQQTLLRSECMFICLKNLCYMVHFYGFSLISSRPATCDRTSPVA